MSLNGAEEARGFHGRTAEPADRAAEIHAAILLAVVEQRLPPGTKLPEDQLAAHFAVSRTLVRGALQALAGDGVVMLARNRGAAVASPSPQDARDLFDARRVVEAATAARAAERAGPDGWAMLDRLTAEGRAALAEGDRGRAIRLSGEFHVALARLAEQPVLEAFLAELVARSSLVIALYGHRGRSDCGDHDHLGLVAALRDRDAGRAVRLMTEHLREIESDLDLGRARRVPVSLAEALRR
ncbi:GntR family transcriptional regulator [Lichenibacterium dinghuense]|uniref:GntR family transcriptional regulator n=1 Tax=Lichenibacterium dinghuense TaxID=2895977 RepID=UPI001F373146|nr:GntR family transcriptional regulator [Lichenibacterium sp. 6Y81]